MKKAILFLSLLILSNPALAEDHNISLNPVNATQIERCAPMPSGLKSIHIVGTEHKGADESVGVIMKKGMVEKVYVGNDVKQVVQDSVRNTLVKCGYPLGSDSDSLQLTVIIDDFFTKSANEGVVGKDTASMSLKLAVKVPGRNQNYQIQYGIEKTAKAPPFMKAKRFEKLLNATLVDVMNQVAMSESLVKTVKAGTEPVSEVQIQPNNTQTFDDSSLED